MESFVFNNFKKNLLEGEIDGTDTWTLYPVNTKFVDTFEDRIRYVKNHTDFLTLSREWLLPHTPWFDKYKTSMNRIMYNYKPMGETDEPQEPRFVTQQNKDNFISDYPENESLCNMFFNPDGCFYREEKAVDVIDTDGNILEKGKKIPKGFYYVRTSEELYWCANKVNGTQYDNTINIVLGDNIGVNSDKLQKIADVNDIDKTDEAGVPLRMLFKKIRYCIGDNPAQPYEGIFFGNGFSIINIELVCTQDICGIIGYLGYDGRISTVNIRGNNIVTCSNLISIDHLVNNGTDVSVGLLCGKNNGKIENVYIDGRVIFNGFSPEIYSVNNKTSNYNSTHDDVYQYYPDYYCFDSIGNIVPYIGYFNEGVFATFSGYHDGKFWHYWNTHVTDNTTYNLGKVTAGPLEWYYWDGGNYSGYGYLNHYTHEKDRVNVLWYDGAIVSGVNAAAGFVNASISDIGLFRTNTATTYHKSFAEMKDVSYFNTSIKLSQQNRAAYYVSPLIGVNNNAVNNVKVNAELYTSGTFVGFMGGIAGKQADGKLSNITTQVSARDVMNTESSGFLYKRDYYNGDQGRDLIKYSFVKKSIKNISSLFGSCIVGGKGSLEMNGVNSYLHNFNNILFSNNGYADPEYDDYYFLNRYGAFAAMVEYNTTNISDIWNNLGELSNPVYRSMYVSNCVFGYDEQQDVSRYRSGYNYGLPYNVFFDERYRPGSEYNMYGVASPLFAEVKPTYQSIPSIISTFFNNKGHFVTTGEDGTNYYRTGLYAIDQNIAGPYTDPYFQCINLEVDLPGVANGNDTLRNSNSIHDFGAAGGVIDRLNRTSGVNFSLDIRDVPGKLINWNNTKSYIIDNFNQAAQPFTTVVLPAAAQIYPTYYATGINSAGQATSEIAECTDISTIPNGSVAVGAGKTVYEYAGNKIYNQFAYFGSDLSLVREGSVRPEYSDLASANQTFTFEFTNPYYTTGKRVFESTLGSHVLGNNVKNIRIAINPAAYKYAPFTTTPLPQEYLVPSALSSFYTLEADLDNSNGTNTYKRGLITPETAHDCVIHDLCSAFDLSEDGRKSLRKMLNCKDNVNPSGFIFYTDYVEGGDWYDGKCAFAYFVIPLQISPYDIEERFYNPPYDKWCGFYMRTRAEESHTLYGFDAATILTDPIYLENKDVSPGTIGGANCYLTGVKVAADGSMEGLYTEPGVIPGIVSAYVTAYDYELNKSDNTYWFKKIGGGLTRNPNEAVTGYVSTETKAGSTVRNKVDYVYTSGYTSGGNADDGFSAFRRYYGTGNDFSHSGCIYPPDDLKVGSTYYALRMYAVPLQGVPSANWNWQDMFEMCEEQARNSSKSKISYNNITDSYDTSYKYGWAGPFYMLKDVNVELIQKKGTVDAVCTYPKSWHDMQYTGTFINDFVNGKNIVETNLAGMPDYNATAFKSENIKPDMLWEFYSDRGLLSDGIKRHFSAASAVDNNGEQSFFKYTYLKSDPVSFDPVFKLPVSYNYANGKAGFWYKFDNWCSAGNNEYNDEVSYYPNIYALGKTINQESLLNHCLSGNKSSWITSAFSADDLQGFLVEDSRQRPVMYIDVGMGECTDGTTWTLSGYPSIDSAAFVDSYSSMHPTATSGEIMDELANVLNKDCSGLFLEVGLDARV